MAAIESDPGPCRHEELIELAAHALLDGDVEPVFERAVGLAADLLEVEQAEILECRRGPRRFISRAEHRVGRRESEPPEPRDARDSQAGYTLRAPGPVTTIDLRLETRFSDPFLRDQRGIVSGLSVVVRGESEPFGVLTANSTRSRAFRTDEMRTLEAIAEIVSGALKRIAGERTLRAAEEKYRTLVEELPLVTYLDELDNESSSVFISPQVAGLSGYAAEEWIDDPGLFYRLVHPDDRERVLAEHHSVRRTGSRLGTEYRLVTRDGRTVWVRDEATVIELGGSPYLQGALIDITEQRRLGEELRQFQKMEAIGQLAGGIAHDFNNLLTGIIGYADYAIEALEPHDPLREDIGQIAAAARRATTLTRQLLAFSRKQVLKPQVIGLNRILAEMESLLGRVLGSEIELELDLDPELGFVRADPSQIEQVILNLAVNARDAMGGAGTLTLGTASVEVDGLNGHPRLARIEPGPYVVLSVTDTGAGMDPETLEQIFEPFFTTKPPGEGTGLGLSTVYGIVEQSGGTVIVSSEPAEGSVFRVYLPCVDEQEEERVEPIPEEVEPDGGTETILLVEDDSFLCKLVARDLRRRGYTVVVARSGAEALEFVQDGLTFDLLLTDVAMPLVDGLELARELERFLGSLKVLFMSGHASSAVARGFEPELVVEKPFRLDELATRIRAVFS